MARQESLERAAESTHRLSFREFRSLAYKGDNEPYFFDKYVFRWLSVPGSYLLALARVPPNAVTLVSLILSISAVWFFLHPTAPCLLIGCLLVFLYHYFDHVDGELARVYAKARGYRQGVAGAYFDLLCHSFSVNLWLPAIAFGLYLETEQPLIMFIGILAFPAMSNFTQYVGSYMLISRIRAAPETAQHEPTKAAASALAGRQRQVDAVRSGAASRSGLAKLAKEVIGYPGMIFLVIIAVVVDAFVGSILGRLGVLVLLTAFHGANNVRRFFVIRKHFVGID